ncbi:hypothetical protein H8D30_00420 [bacterium]|nr:hypothetical protein [bacterium]
MGRVLFSITNLLLGSHIRIVLRATGFEVQSVPPSQVSLQIAKEVWDMVVVDLSDKEIGPPEAFPKPLPVLHSIGLITHRDMELKDEWEEYGFRCVFRSDFFQNPEQFLFPDVD